MKIVSAVLVSVNVAMVTGCTSPDDVSTSAILYDLSPEMLTVAERPIDSEANVNVVADLNSRMFYGDIGRVLYTNQPSRLTPYPMYGLSGVPW